MLKAKYIHNGNKHTLKVKGHANFDEYGKDIVCAAVSSIVLSLSWWAENHPNAVERIEMNDGDAVISCNGGVDVEAVFDMAVTGIERIAYWYPHHVQIDIGFAD